MDLFSRPFSGKSKEGHDSQSSFAGFRWSSIDLKNKLFRTSKEDPAEGKRKAKNKLTAEERKQRRLERLEKRKEKKSKREKDRRNNVNGLFDDLGNAMGVSKESKGNRLSILATAIDKIKTSKGDMTPTKRMDDIDLDFDEEDYDEDDEN